jgi:hypothetical protein
LLASKEDQPALSRRQDLTADLRQIRKRLIKKCKFRANRGERRAKDNRNPVTGFLDSFPPGSEGCSTAASACEGLGPGTRTS